MNEKAKCNNLKGSKFKNNKQKLLLYKNLERTIVLDDHKDYPWVNTSPCSSLCGFSWNEYQKCRA